MPEVDVVELFVEPLDRLGIRYLIRWIHRRGLDAEWQKIVAPSNP
jgi:hypothetical protein